MAMRRRAIIGCALTGAIHTPSMSPYFPVTLEEIVAEGRRAAEAGAAILHGHVRDPETGRSDRSVEARALPGLKGGGEVGFQRMRIGAVAAGGLRVARRPGKMGQA